VDDQVKRLRVHFGYVSLILILIIIAIATDRWTHQGNFTEYLSNAATMTSLLLGLVAIFYSFVSNDGLSKSLGSISTVSDEVRQSKAEIARFVSLTQDTNEKSAASSVLMRDASAEIRTNLTSLNDTLSAIQRHQEVLYGSVEKLPSRLDELERKIFGVTKSPVQTSSSSLLEPDPVLVKTFLEISALSCNLFTYACVLANGSQKPLSIDAFCAAIDVRLALYFSGFLGCMSATRMISYKITDSPGFAYTITRVHPVLEVTTKGYIMNYIDRAFADDPEKRAKNIADLEKVEALFK
jgi:hypothetical protein